MGPRLRLRAVGLAAAVALTMAAFPLAAASQGNLTATLSNAVIAFPTPGVGEFDTGWIDHPGLVISITSRPQRLVWELRIRADAPNMGGYGKPVADLLWRHAGSGTWTPLSGTDAAVIQGTGDQDVTLYFRTLLDWALDAPDFYAAGLTFTVLRP